MTALLHDYATLKFIHIMSSTFLWGTGIGTFFFMVMAHFSRDIATIRITARHVVIADWIFTLPTVVIQPVTGIMLMSVTGFPFDSTWFLAVSGLYVIVTACWIPVVFIQVRLRDVTKPLRDGDALPPEYHRLFRRWVTLGFPAGISMAVIFALMVFKPWLA